jgi:hypothetical protein
MTGRYSLPEDNLTLENLGLGKREFYFEFGSSSFLTFYLQRTFMCLHNIIIQSLPGRFGGEERLEDFAFNGGGDTGAVVGNRYFYPPAPLKGVVVT